MRKFILTFAFLMIPAALTAQQELTNESIVKMVKAGLSSEIVVATVNSQPGHYDLSAEGLIAMKKAGVSDPIISAIIARNSSGGAAPNNGAMAGPGGAAQSGGAGSWGDQAPGTAGGNQAGMNALGPNGLPQGVDSVGMYFRDKTGNWNELGAEVVNFKTAGALKHLGSVGIVKEDLNGFVSGFHSHQQLSLPADFLIYVQEGQSPGEFQLLKFRVNSSSREFRSLTGGVAHTKGGAERDTVDFTSKKIAPRLYEITLGTDVGKGEFGFLPPLEGSGKNVESSSHIYTFSVSD